MALRRPVGGFLGLAFPRSHGGGGILHVGASLMWTTQGDPDGDGAWPDTGPLVSRPMFSIAEGASAAFLAATFTWAALSKASRPTQWRQDLGMFPLPRLVRGLSFMVLPWIELALAAALALGQTWAAIPLLALLGGFCAAIVRARLVRGNNKLTCGCFGSSRVRDYRLFLLRNVTLVGLSVLVLIGRLRGTPLPWSVRRGAILAALFSSVALAATLWMMWQLAAYARRVEQAQQRSRAAAFASGETAAASAAVSGSTD